MHSFKQWLKKNFGRWIYRAQLSPARKDGMERWLQQWNGTNAGMLSDTSQDIFTYHGEDGIIQYLLGRCGNVPQIFVDIGSGDCIKSNCAALAVHYGWQGVFVDTDESQLSVGRSFYRNLVKPGAIKIIQAHVQADNINALLQGAGLDGHVGLLSIDIDGNDYWIWEALDCIQPAIVVIEAKVEFGKRSIAVPFGSFNHHSVDKMYNGASVEAFCKLAARKGYKLAGANKQGYNLFFVKNEAPLDGVSSAAILRIPEAAGSFYPESFFEEHKFEII